MSRASCSSASDGDWVNGLLAFAVQLFELKQRAGPVERSACPRPFRAPFFRYSRSSPRVPSAQARPRAEPATGCDLQSGTGRFPRRATCGCRGGDWRASRWRSRAGRKAGTCAGSSRRRGGISTRRRPISKGPSRSTDGWRITMPISRRCIWAAAARCGGARGRGGAGGRAQAFRGDDEPGAGADRDGAAREAQSWFEGRRRFSPSCRRAWQCRPGGGAAGRVWGGSGRLSPCGPNWRRTHPSMCWARPMPLSPRRTAESRRCSMRR